MPGGLAKSTELPIVNGEFLVGKFSRAKGSREERGLVAYLNERGYVAIRSPFSGATTVPGSMTEIEKIYKPDVIAEKDGNRYTFEMKSRKKSFAGLYKVYDLYRGENKVVRFSMSSSGPHVAFGTDFEEVKKAHDVHFTNLVLSPPSPQELKIFERILKFNKWRKKADFLVCKDNNNHRLFFKYWI